MHWIARECEAEGRGERPHEQRLGDAGHVIEEHVPVGEQRNDEKARLVGFADDDAPHLLLYGTAEPGGGHPSPRRTCITFHSRPPKTVAGTTLHGATAPGEVEPANRDTRLAGSDGIRAVPHG